MSSFNPSQPKTRALLTQAAQLAGNKDFQHLTPKKKIGLFTALIREKIHWSAEVSSCPIEHLATFDHALNKGIGNCQHMSVLLMTMLKVSGHNARLVRYLPPVGAGHIWVETEIPDGAVTRTFVADPSRADYVKPIADVFLISFSRTNSLEAQWYAHPNRIYD